MAEPAEATLPRTGASGPDGLLATKLYVPRPQPGFVLRRAQRPVAWLSLDAGDNDPARFWRHAIAALGAVRPGVAEHVAPLSARRHRRPSRAW